MEMEMEENMKEETEMLIMAPFLRYGRGDGNANHDTLFTICHREFGERMDLCDRIIIY
jgi:hypothetical protein